METLLLNKIQKERFYKMKKFLSLLICLVFIFAIVSCSSNTSNKSENADNFSSDENVILDTVSNLDEPEGICPSGSHSKYLSTAIDEIPELLMTTSVWLKELRLGRKKRLANRL